MKKLAAVLAALWVAALPVYSQSADKIRVIAAPGVTKTDPKDWKNTLTVSGQNLVLSCAKCTPTQSITTPVSDIAVLHYGQNAYHHWVAGIATGVLSLGAGLIVGLMPHHEHYFSIDQKDGKVIGVQADKDNYRQIAGMLQNSTGLPIEVTAKEAHFMNGFNTKIVEAESKSAGK